MKTFVGLAALAAVALPLSTALPPSASAQRFCNEMPAEPENNDPERGCDIGGPIGETDPTRPGSKPLSTSSSQSDGNAELDRLITDSGSDV